MHSRRNFLKAGLLIAGAIPSAAAYQAFAGDQRFRDDKQGIDDDLRAIKSRLEGGDPSVWLFTGDSITQGAKHTHGWRSYPEVFAERVRWELGRVRDVVINTAVSGNTTADLLADWKWRVDHFKPQIVSVMMGTNDCAASKKVNRTDFERNLSAIVSRVRDMGAIPVLHVPTPIIAAKATERSNLPAYAQTVVQVAERNGVIGVDHWAYWQDAIRQKGESQVFADWLNDPLHPNGMGHLEMARLLFKRLQIFDESAATCGAPYYEGEH